MTKQELKDAACKIIDERRDEIINIGETIRVNPELGYKEYKTAAFVESIYEKMGLEYENKIAITGSMATLKGKSSKVKLAVMGELDAIIIPTHPQADPETGAAHSCGHFMQVATMLGVGMALKFSGAMEHLDGDVVLVATPAEEAVEIEYRNGLIEQGIIEFVGGKQEMIAKGYFDDIDMAMMCHGITSEDIQLAETSVGVLIKYVKYIGKAAHAGAAPHLGINALNAANLGLTAVHMQRETFKDEDTIRVHPIIIKGGDLVNVVPEDVRIETYVRGKTMDGIIDASKKVNRALKAGADAIGASVEIKEIPGYMPRFNNKIMNELFYENAVAVVGKDKVTNNGHTTGSSDFGDIMHIMPGIHPYIGGASGVGHSGDYQVADPDLYYIAPTKAMAMTAIDLLYDNAAAAHNVLENYTPVYKNKEEFVAA